MGLVVDDVGADIEHVDDVGIAELGEGARLRAQALVGSGGPAGALAHDLDRHVAVELGVAGLEDRSEAALSQLAHQRVATDRGRGPASSQTRLDRSEGPLALEIEGCRGRRRFSLQLERS